MNYIEPNRIGLVTISAYHLLNLDILTKMIIENNENETWFSYCACRYIVFSIWLSELGFVIIYDANGC